MPDEEHVDSIENGQNSLLFTQSRVIGFLGSAFVILLLVFLLESSGTTDFLQISFPLQITDTVRIVTGLGSLGLSLGLLLLYDRQAEIQRSQRDLSEDQTRIAKQQTEIMVAQTELSELEHKPILEVSNIGTKTARDVDFFEIEISNIGKGIARNIEIELKPDFDFPESTSAEICFEESRWVPVREVSFTGVRADSSFLRAGEQDVKFLLSAGLNIGVNQDHTTRAAFELATEQLADVNKDWLRLKLIFHFSDSQEHSYEEEFADLLLPIKGRTRLRTAVEYGSTVDDYHGPRPGPDRSSMEENSGYTYARYNPKTGKLEPTEDEEDTPIG
ncbi:hypothetical protein [Haloferax sp. KTX1]|uniref:hypothetical protein n=1 Tax=Haloferax sp. KTX1 TaxID=2600597 RepID=UPI0011DD6751|nr:hypothetical protein [Haloferax sp. KTX1]